MRRSAQAPRLSSSSMAGRAARSFDRARIVANGILTVAAYQLTGTARGSIGMRSIAPSSSLFSPIDHVCKQGKQRHAVR